jgi:hypothetical protein
MISWRELSIRLGLLIASFTVGFGLIEAAIRLWEKNVVAFLPITIENYASQKVIDMAGLNYNETAVPRIKPDNEFRVLSFGDSFAHGIVTPDYTYHRVAAKIASIATGQNVKLVNLGEPGTSFQQYIRAYNVWAQLLEHDAVIFNIYIGNDIIEATYNMVSDNTRLNQLFINARIDPSTGELLGVRPPSLFGSRSLGYARQMMFAREFSKNENKAGPQYKSSARELPEARWLSIANAQLDNSDPAQAGALAHGYSQLAELAKTAAKADKANKKVMFILSPNQLQVDDPFRNRVYSQYNRKSELFDLDLGNYLASMVVSSFDHKLPIIDVTPALRCLEALGTSTYWRTNTHWSVEGNHIVGEVLGRAISSLWFGKEVDNLTRDDQACASTVSANSRWGLPGATDIRSNVWNDALSPRIAGDNPFSKTPDTGGWSISPDGRPTHGGKIWAEQGRFRGWVESANSVGPRTIAAGWSFEAAAPNDPVHILAVRGNKVVGYTKARIARHDVDDAIGAAITTPGFTLVALEATPSPGEQMRFLAVGKFGFGVLNCNPQNCRVSQ